jgi:hypothetical protein
LAPECLVADDARFAGQFALVVEGASLSRRFLIASQWQGEQLQFVGFNEIGARLFHGQMAAGRLTAEASRLYRGPAVEPLVWGLLVHQVGEHLPGCWPQGKLQTEGKLTILKQGRQVLYHSSASGRFALPSEGAEVRIERLD